MKAQNSLKNVSAQHQMNTAQRILNLVQSVSTSGKYQTKLIIYFLFAAFFTSLPIFGSHLFYLNPVFSCQNMEGKVIEDEACRIIDFCTDINKGTITSDLQLYCDSKKNDRIFIQTAQGYGIWIGLIFVILVSDHFGKKTCFAFGVIMANLTWILQLIGVSTKSVWLLFIADIITGCSTKILSLNFYIIITRFAKKRQYEMITLGWLLLSRSLTQMFIAGINQIFNQWSIIVWIYAVGIMVSSIMAFFILKQDPVFLIHGFQVQRAKKVIQQIGQQNEESPDKIKQSIDKINAIVQDLANRAQVSHNQENEFNLRQILRCDIILNVFLIGLAGFFYMLSAKSIEFSIQDLKYSYNFNLFLLGLSNVCGFSTAFYLMKVENKRKRGLLYTILIYCVIAMLFFFPFCTSSGIVESIVIFSLRFVLSWNSNFYIRLQVDSFPQKYQGTLIAISQTLITAGIVYGPPITQKIIEKHLNPILMIALVRLVLGFIPMFLIKEEKIELDIQGNKEAHAKRSQQ